MKVRSRIMWLRYWKNCMLINREMNMAYIPTNDFLNSVISYQVALKLRAYGTYSNDWERTLKGISSLFTVFMRKCRVRYENARVV